MGPVCTQSHAFGARRFLSPHPPHREPATSFGMFLPAKHVSLRLQRASGRGPERCSEIANSDERQTELISRTQRGVRRRAQIRFAANPREPVDGYSGRLRRGLLDLPRQWTRKIQRINAMTNYLRNSFDALWKVPGGRVTRIPPSVGDGLSARHRRIRSSTLGSDGTEPILSLHPLEALMLRDGSDRDRSADGFGRAIENFTKPIVVSTRNRARSTASRIGMASTKRSSKSAGESLACRSRASSGVSPLPVAASSKPVPSPKIRRLSASYSPSHRMPKSCSPCTWVGAGELGPSSRISQTSASGRSAEYPHSRTRVQTSPA